MAPDALTSAIWQLRLDHPFCPKPPPEPRTPRGFEGVRLLGEGDASPDPADLKDAPGGVESGGGEGGGEGGGKGGGERGVREGWWEWMRWCASRRRLRGMTEEGPTLGQRVVELRLSLHLNAAAAALRLEDWELAVCRRRRLGRRRLGRRRLGRRHLGPGRLDPPVLMTGYAPPTLVGPATARSAA